jgi:hypothetical protein
MFELPHRLSTTGWSRKTDLEIGLPAPDVCCRIVFAEMNQVAKPPGLGCGLPGAIRTCFMVPTFPHDALVVSPNV